MAAAPSRILLVEDVLSMAMLYRKQLESVGYDVMVADSLAAARHLKGEQEFDLMLLDLNLPDGDGLTYLETLRQEGENEIPAIVITADASLKNAVFAMKLGALDYLVKPFPESRLVTTVLNALERVALRQQLDAIRQEKHTSGAYGIIGKSLAMQKVFRRIENVAGSKATVFISGQSGTGKEMCAEAIHKAGPRSARPFVAVNCAAIPENLLESELFGHLKGSFTGALDDREGFARAADKGTLFLDEICEMDLNLQKKLLRFLQTGTVQPVGSAHPIAVDVRVVCATNKDPLQEVREGRFREDLYFRLNVVPVHLPALSTREGDVVEIAQQFLADISAEEGKTFTGFDQTALDFLRSYTWPGNIRELQNAIRNIVVLNDGGRVDADMFPRGNSDMVAIPVADHALKKAGVGDGLAVHAPLDNFQGMTLGEIEQMVVHDRIRLADGSIPKAAKSLSVSASTIYRKLERWQQ